MKPKKLLLFLGLYTILFLITFVLAYSPFLLEGKSFIWSSDGRNQHYPMYVYIGRAIRKYILGFSKGNFSIPLFDISLGLGGDIIGYMNSWGINDPLILTAAFVPTKYIEILYGFLAIFRVYLAGLSFIFLCKYFKKPILHGIIGSIVYCFSGYAITCCMRHPYFVVPMIQLPLLIVGLDKILKREKPYIFVFAIFYSAICEYYHLYMMTILLVLYAFIRFFELYRENRIKQFFQAVGRTTGYYMLGIGLSAVVLLPSVYCFLTATRAGYSNYNGSYTWPWYRTRLLRFIAPPGSWDDMAFAAIVLFSVILLFFSKQKWVLKQITVLSLLIYLTSIGGLIMNGFQYSSNRWTFGLVLVLAFVIVEMLPDLLELSPRNQMICIFTLCVYAIFAFSTKATRKTSYVLIGILFLSLTLLILTLWKNTPQKTLKTKAFIKKLEASQYCQAILCLFLVICNVGINGIYKFSEDQGNYMKEFQEFGKETELLEETAERELEPYLLNNPKGRGDSTLFNVNRAMDWHIPGMLTYNAAVNGNIADFWNEIENCGNDVKFSTHSTEQQTMATTLLSGKYYVEKMDSKISYAPYGYIPVKQTENENLIYENIYALPWGYTYDQNKTISYEALSKLNGIQKQELMLQAIALEDIKNDSAMEFIEFSERKLPYEIEYKNCMWKDGILTVEKENATAILSFNMHSNVEGFLRLENFDINKSGLASFRVRVVCNSISRTAQTLSHLYTWYYGRENYLFNLGYSQEERKTLTITFPVKGTFELGNIELYALPMDNYVNQVEALREEPLENIKMDTNCVLGTIDLSKDKILCMSIPYSKGWTVTVDDKKVEIQRGNYMFMAIPVPKGHHNIKFTYCSPGIRLGAIISIVCFGIVLGMIFCDRKKHKI